MQFKHLLSLTLAAAACLPALADQPFRDHRYSSFEATPTEAGQIVFAGNSITNMHSWFEAFGSHQEVIGRGNSGGFAYELLDNLENYIDGKPSKFFLMIGTNDISAGQSAAITAKRIKAIVKRVRLESPETEVYVQSILPRSGFANKGWGACNTEVSAWITEQADSKVHFIDLTTVCAGIENNSTWTHDYLHPRPTGYAAWCHEIEDEVGYPTVYPETISSQNSCGLSGSPAARVEQFPYFPVSEGDVLIFGDEIIHGGEWHELLRSNKIKERGLMWGWGGITLSPNAVNVVASALQDQAVKPAKVILNYGIGGQNTTNYQKIIDKVKELAPAAQIYLMSLAPSTNATNNSAYSTLNTWLKAQCDANDDLTYIDIYTPLNADLSKNIQGTNYLTGRGYVLAANAIAEALNDSDLKPVSIEEYDALVAKRRARKIVGDALTDAFVNATYGTGPGQVNPDNEAKVEALVPEIVKVLDNENLTSEQAQEAANQIYALTRDYKLDVDLSDENETHWYTFCSARENRYATAQGTAMIGVQGDFTTSTGNNVWKFVKRADGTLDIINGLDQYISPDAAYNTQIHVTTTQPSAGWQLSYSDQTAGNMVIYSGNNCQLNQCGSAQSYAVYNWHNQNSMPDRDDQGCSYLISAWDGTLDTDTEVEALETGWYVINMASGAVSSLGTATTIVNADEEFRQNATNYYALKFEDQPTEKLARAYVHVTLNEAGDKWVFQAADGHAVLENCTSGREVSWSNTPTMTVTSTPGVYGIGKWSTYSNTAGISVGKSSSSNNTYKFQRVSDEELGKYDVWTVSIIANTATEIGQDTRITLTSDANQGIATAYNHGHYFLTPGTEVTRDMLTITPAEGVEQTYDEPQVIIDQKERTISVNYTTYEEPMTLADGWYTMTLSGFQGTRDAVKGWVEDLVANETNVLQAMDAEYEQNLNNTGNYFYYFMGFAAAPEEAPLSFIKVAPATEGTASLQSPNGHYVAENGTASLEPFALAVENNGAANFIVPLCPWVGNNIGAPIDPLGMFGSGSEKGIYTFAEAATDAYDLYTVKIDDEPEADKICNREMITVSKAQGLKSVYSGGTLFLTKGTALAEADVTAPARDGMVTVITITDGQITVSYQEEDGIQSVEAAEGASACYDLLGRRVKTPTRGLYIQSGRKILR